MKLYLVIKEFLLIKKFNEVRIAKFFWSIKNIYEWIAFPVTKFWEHIIVINFYEPIRWPNYEDFIKNEFLSFNQKILDETYIVIFMEEKNIELPSQIKELFIKFKCYKQILKL